MSSGGYVKKYIVLIVFSLLILLASCSNNTNNPNVYEIKIDFGEESQTIIKQVQQGDELVLPDAPMRDGYVFLGWYSDGNAVYGNKIIARKNMTVTGKWYKADGSILTNGMNLAGATHNSTSILTFSYSDTNAPTSVLWTWKIDEKIVAESNLSFSISTGDYLGEHRLALTCNGKEINSLIFTVTQEEVYSIKYLIEDGLIYKDAIRVNSVVNIFADTENADLIIAPNQVITGWTVIEPIYLAISDNQFTMPSSDVIIKANTSVKEYRVSIENNGGFTLTPEVLGSYAAGSKVTLPSAIKENYKAIWYLDGVCLNSDEFIMPEHDVLLKVEEGGVPHNITISNPDSLELSFTSYTPSYEGTLISLPKVNSTIPPEYEVIFEIDGEVWNSDIFTMKNSDVEITVRKCARKYSIFYNLDGWNCPHILPSEVSYKDEVNLPTTLLSKPGYTFTKWIVAPVDSQIDISDDQSKFNMPAYNLIATPKGSAESHNIKIYHKYVNTVLKEEDRTAYTDDILTVGDFEGIELYEYNYSSYSIGGTSINVERDEEFTMPASDITITINYNYKGTNIIGGRIYLDRGREEGVEYTFYDQNRNKINYDGYTLSQLDNAVSYTVKGQPKRDRFYVAYLDGNLIEGVKYWGFYNNTDLSDIGDTIGIGKSATNRILSYINTYCVNEKSSDEPNTNINLTNKGRYSLYRNCGRYIQDNNLYLFDRLKDWQWKLWETYPQDYYIPNNMELMTLALFMKEKDIKIDGNSWSTIFSKGVWSSSTHGYGIAEVVEYYKGALCFAAVGRNDGRDHVMIPIRSF